MLGNKADGKSVLTHGGQAEIPGQQPIRHPGERPGVALDSRRAQFRSLQRVRDMLQGKRSLADGVDGIPIRSDRGHVILHLHYDLRLPCRSSCATMAASRQ